MGPLLRFFHWRVDLLLFVAFGTIIGLTPYRAVNEFDLLSGAFSAGI